MLLFTNKSRNLLIGVSVALKKVRWCLRKNSLKLDLSFPQTVKRAAPLWAAFSCLFPSPTCQSHFTALFGSVPAPHTHTVLHHLALRWMRSPPSSIILITTLENALFTVIIFGCLLAALPETDTLSQTPVRTYTSGQVIRVTASRWRMIGERFLILTPLPFYRGPSLRM